MTTLLDHNMYTLSEYMAPVTHCGHASPSKTDEHPATSFDSTSSVKPTGEDRLRINPKVIASARAQLLKTLEAVNLDKVVNLNENVNLDEDINMASDMDIKSDDIVEPTDDIETIGIVVAQNV